MEVPDVRYARSGDVAIAYQVVGSGEHDVVFVPGFVSNVELGWQIPELAAMYRRIASFCRLIVFDKRGTGLSDRVAGMPQLETRMDDVRAVMEAAGSERAALLGISEGGPMTLLFAATHPDRTTAVVVFGCDDPVGVRTPETPWVPTRDESMASLQRRERMWGTVEAAREWLMRRAPRRADDEDFVRLWASYLRGSASPAAVAQLGRMNLEIDIRSALGAITVPTLLVHRVDDGVPVENARFVAERAPAARLLELPGEDHLAFLDFEQWVPTVEEFFGDAWAARAWEERESERVLATVLFTDIVGSTARAAELGDRAWRELVTQHHRLVRRELARFRGHEHDTAGDGFFASFDGPARAIRCACAIADAVRELDLEIRAGLHTGECERIGGKVGGIAVHIGARVAASAQPGEVLVSSTVKDLVAGSGLEFDDRGATELRGVPGEWRLYAIRR